MGLLTIFLIGLQFLGPADVMGPTRPPYNQGENQIPGTRCNIGRGGGPCVSDLQRQGACPEGYTLQRGRCRGNNSL